MSDQDKKQALKSLYIGFYSDYWFKVWQRFHDDYNISPLLITWPTVNRKNLLATFPYTRQLDWHDINRNRYPSDLESLVQAPFDLDCEYVWTHDAQLVYDQYHRWNLSSDLGTLERSQHFYQQLVFWNAYLKQEQPDFIIFRTAPHGIFDLILLLLAKRLRILHITISHTSVLSDTDGAYYHLASRDLGGGTELSKCLRIAKWEKEAGLEVLRENLPPRVNDYLTRIQSNNYSKAIPAYQKNSTNYQTTALEGIPDFSQIKGIYRVLSKTLADDLLAWRNKTDSPNTSPIDLGLYKEKGQELEKAYVGYFARTRFALDRIRDRYRITKLKKKYNHYVSTTPFSKDTPSPPFVFVPLHFQPEMTTNPMGGIFTQQLLMINIISHSIPSDWEILIKEHPAQFRVSPGVNLTLGHPARNDQYYRILSEIPKVRLLPLNIDQFEMIDHCQVVATVTGTVGWEAIARKKTALVFGDAWYAYNQGAFRIRNLHDCRSAIKSIQKGIDFGEAELLLMLKEIEITGFDIGFEFTDTPLPPELALIDAEKVSTQFARTLNLSPKNPKTVQELLELPK